MFGHKPVVLIVDDESGILRLLDICLSQNGFEVASASDGESALRACRECRVDFLLCDVVLPDSSGPLLARKLLQLHPEMRVIFMSGWDDEHLDRHALPRGCDLLKKPFKIEGVLAAIRHAPARERGRARQALMPPRSGEEYWRPGLPDHLRHAPAAE